MRIEEFDALAIPDAYRILQEPELLAHIELLQRKVAALRLATSAIGARLLERYSDALAAARAELERRRV